MKKGAIQKSWIISIYQQYVFLLAFSYAHTCNSCPILLQMMLTWADKDSPICIYSLWCFVLFTIPISMTKKYRIEKDYNTWVPLFPSLAEKRNKQWQRQVISSVYTEMIVYTYCCKMQCNCPSNSPSNRSLYCPQFCFCLMFILRQWCYNAETQLDFSSPWMYYNGTLCSGVCWLWSWA